MDPMQHLIPLLFCYQPQSSCASLLISHFPYYVTSFWRSCFLKKAAYRLTFVWLSNDFVILLYVFYSFCLFIDYSALYPPSSVFTLLFQIKVKLLWKIIMFLLWYGSHPGLKFILRIDNWNSISKKLLAILTLW